MRSISGIAALPLLCGLMAAPPSQGQTADATVHPERWPSPRWPIARDPETEARIAALLARMTIEEKVGQVIQADIASVTPDDVRRYHLGSILNGGSSGPGGNDLAPAAEWLALADRFYEASVDTSGGRAAIPVLWGTDAVHGHSNIIGATLFPHNIGLGAARDPELIERIGKATAVEIRTTGMEWTFAPTVTVPRDYRWGRAYEGYSSDPALVSAYTERMIRGLQGAPSDRPLLAGPHVLASTKHFIADGGTFEGRDQGDARISEAELRDIHGKPYDTAIESGVGTVMTSFSSWQGVKIAGHKGLVTGVLKKRMNFDGFVVTDWNAHGQVAGCTNASCPQAINAGIDMYMAPDSWKPLYASLLAQVKDGTVPMARLDDAVARILRVKFRLGLFDAGKPSQRALSGRFELLGAAEHRALAREAVRKSLVLLKNAGNVLPLRPGARILVAGDGADDIARQSGGWTLSWQGTGVDNSHFPGATSIWRGIEQAVQAAGGSAHLSPDGSFSERPDAAIVVFGETPYAEFQGDIKSLQLRFELRKPIDTMRKLKAQGVPVVAVMLTGRPLFVNPALNAADAFVVAWLPGSEGGGVADLLLGGASGRPRHRFTGRLPAVWPATARHDGPRLFDFGYGLDVGTPATRWQALSEDPGIEDAGGEGVYFDRGVPAPSWSLSVSDGVSAETRITTVPARALDGRATIAATDHLVQEGARRFAISGAGASSVRIDTHAPVDLSRETNGDVMLVFSLRLDRAPAAPLALAMRCGPGCVGRLPVPALSRLATGLWHDIAIPLKCFADAGANMTRISTVFEIEAASPAEFSLARVAADTHAEQVLPCR